MQTITIEVTLNAAFYQEHFKQNDMSRKEMKRELRREIKDKLREMNFSSILDLIEAIPALPVSPRIVITDES